MRIDLSPADVRVEVAKRVLKLVASSVIVPTKGVFLADDSGTWVHEIVLVTRVAAGVPCLACATGAMFLVLCLYEDNGYVRATGGSRFAPFFDVPMLDAMEAAFEYWDSPDYPTPPDDGFGLDPTTRMVSIMQNIIDNKGDFVGSCSSCGHAAHVPGDCNHGYSPHTTPLSLVPGMREDEPGSGCVCGVYSEGAAEKIKVTSNDAK